MPAAATPADTRLTCPRCKTLRFFVSIDGGVTYVCGGCEWRFTLGTPTVATPGVPGSTVNATNTTGTIVAVTITGGTLTAVTVNAVQVGTTAGTYLVPAGGTINITYTVAPAWAWALPTINATVVAGALALPVASGGTYAVAGMQFLVDTGANAEAVVAAPGAIATSIPVSALGGTAGLAKGHTSGAVFGNPLLVPTFNAVGEQAVPAAPGWGF